MASKKDIRILGEFINSNSDIEAYVNYAEDLFNKLRNNCDIAWNVIVFLSDSSQVGKLSKLNKVLNMRVQEYIEFFNDLKRKGKLDSDDIDRFNKIKNNT